MFGVYMERFDFAGRRQGDAFELGSILAGVEIPSAEGAACVGEDRKSQQHKQA
jgi:hypothetical protein